MTFESKVIENGTIRKLVYGFLFAFHSNYDSMLYRRNLVEMRIFSYPLHLAPPLGGSEYCHAVWYMEKLDWCGYPMVKKVR